MNPLAFSQLARLPWPVWFLASRSDDRLIESIREGRRSFRAKSDAALRIEADQLRYAVRSGRTCNELGLVVPAFALIIEATRRVLGLELYETQVRAGIVMARGMIAEMATGEGKTLAALLPATLYSLSGRGVHVATPNVYLAARDFELTAPIFGLLGINSGLVDAAASPEAKHAAYRCDVTYATGYDLGFDFLRDQVQLNQETRATLGSNHRALLRGEAPNTPLPFQPQRHWAVIDEIDSVLIDEACLPLILADKGSEPIQGMTACIVARKMATSLNSGEDFVLDAQTKSLHLTHQGVLKIHEVTTAQQESYELKRPWTVYVEQALRAELLYKADVDYVVQNGKIVLVDKFTGRLFPDRLLRDGLHQAIEAKEGKTISIDHPVAARVTRQRFFRLYRNLCGMSGTAIDARNEFRRQYRLDVVPIPLHKPCRRLQLRTRLFADSESKWQAIVREILDVHRTQRPVLVGSRTIHDSELLAHRLAGAGVKFALLNGKQDSHEAEIIAQAGLPGAITLATNMAGRGTDIQLGSGVAELGGLHVLVVECHESRRIDRQLLGRAGRQGDPGTGRIFVSADDELICRFGPRLRRSMQMKATQGSELHEDLSREVASTQRRAEAAAFAERRRMLAHDRWLDEVGQSIS